MEHLTGPYEFGDPDTSEFIRYDEESPDIITYATFPKLVQELTRLNKDYELVEKFLLCYPAYVTPDRLLDLLINRYMGPDENTSPTIKEAFEAERKNILLGVVYFLKRWMMRRLEDFIEGPQLVKRIEEWKNYNEQTKADPYLTNTYNLILEKIQSEKKVPPLPKIVPTVTITLSQIDPIELAQQITLNEHENMTSIRSHEFLKQSWNKSDKKHLAPSLINTINWFNRVSGWFCTEIVKAQSIEERSVCISNLIICGSKCAEYHNYNGIMEVLSALHSSSISRLKQSWAMIPMKHIEEFQKLGVLMSPKLNYKNYREALKLIVAPYVPYMGVFLTDFTFLDDCKPDEFDGLLNFEKICDFGTKIKELAHFSEVPYKFKANDDLMDQIKNAEVWDENNIYKISKLRESTTNDPTANNRRRVLDNQFNKMAKHYQKVNLTGHQNVDTKHAELNERDWQLLLTGAALNTYQKDDIVVEDGVYNPFLYRLRAGSVRVEKMIEGKPVQVATLTEGSMFGEMSVLDRNGKTTAAVIANEEGTELYAFELDFVLRLFQSQPGLSKRFFKNLAIKLARRLRQRSSSDSSQTSSSIKKTSSCESIAELASPVSIQSTEPLSPPKRFQRDPEKVLRRQTTSSAIFKQVKVASVKADKKEHRDEKITKRLNLNEAIVQEFPCALKKKRQTVTGKLYITQSSVAFYARVFGIETKETLLFTDIDTVDKAKTDDGIIIKFKGKEIHLVLKAELDLLYELLTGVQKQKKDHANMESKVRERRSVIGTIESESPQYDDPLTKEDRDLILQGAKLIKHVRNDVVLQEGQVFQKIYQISKGSCRITKKIGEADLTLGSMQTGEMFGEISFLDGSGAAVSVIADTPEVELHVIEGYYINILFEMNGGFAGRFFHYLCTVLAGRLSK